MRQLPSYDETLSLPTGNPTTVTADLCDENGHLNVRHYLGIYDDGEWTVFGSAGLGDEHAALGHGGIFALEQHVTYRREVLLDQQVTVRLRLLERTDRMLHLVSYLTNDTLREVAGSLEGLYGYVDFDARRLSAFPEAGASALDVHVAEARRLPWQPELAGIFTPR